MTVTATKTPTALRPGDKLDRYDLLCPIAEGGMASVWVARMRGKYGFEKLVAIKTILPRFAADTRFRDMFLDEARIASRIEHPNVARIFDLGEENGVLYLVMEYVDGDSLSKLNRSCLKKNVEIPIGIVMRVLADACAGLHEAHEVADAAGKPMGIVHRDVSPHNVLISTRGIVKLIDFGIAKTESEGETPESQVLKGKIQYMSPEQALGRPVDRRADVWAVGAILYHLIAGRPPYEGPNQLATLQLLSAGLPPRPLPAEVPPAIGAVVRKALERDPSRRYATAADLGYGLERAMVAAQRMTSSADVSAFSARHLAGRAHRRRDAIDQALTGRGAAAAGAPGPARPPPFVSLPPPGASSYVTPGSAALDASRPVTESPTVRRSAATALAFVFGFAVVVGVALTVLRPKRPENDALTAVAAAAMQPAPRRVTSTSPWADAAPPSSPPSDVPAIAASAPRLITELPAASASPLGNSTTPP